MDKGKADMGYGGEVPPPYSPAYAPGYQPPPNVAPVPPPVGFATGAYPQQVPYVGVPTTATTTVQVVQFANLRSRSTRLTCPHCRADVSTRVRYQVGRFTHLAALVLCLICCPCGIVPYCLEECQDAEHYCPNCQQYIGIYRR